MIIGRNLIDNRKINLDLKIKIVRKFVVKNFIIGLC